MRICPNCNSPVEENAYICPYCLYEIKVRPQVKEKNNPVKPGAVPGTQTENPAQNLPNNSQASKPVIPSGTSTIIPKDTVDPQMTDGNYEYQRIPQKKSKSVLSWIIRIVVVVGLIVGLMEYFEKESARKAAEAQLEAQREAEEAAKAEAEAIAQIYREFGIDENTLPDYSTVLNFEEYKYYDSGEENFNFYYPTTLYNHVDTTTEDSEYGEMMRTVKFSNGDNNRLEYSLIQQDNASDRYNSKQENAKAVYDREKSKLVDIVEILPPTEGGTFVLSGYEDSAHERCAYILTNVDFETVKMMYVVFSKVENDEDQSYKYYYTECLYRLCGFTNSSKACRTYEEFIQS